MNGSSKDRPRIRDRFSTIASRIVVIVILLGGLVGLGAYYDASYEAHWPYPTSEEIDEDYDQHVGEHALIFGTVISDEGGVAQIRVFHESGSFVMTVQGTPIEAQPGGFVQVYGTLAAGNTITADRVVVVNRDASSSTYKYSVSLIGALLVLVVFFRYWRIDTRSLSIEERTDG